MKLNPHNFEKTKNNGFSLIEILAVTLILGIVSAIAAPNLMAFFSHHRVRNGIIIINGAIKETQKQAIRQGISCDLVIDTVARRITANPTNPDPLNPTTCLPETKAIDDDNNIANDDLTVRTNIVIPAANTIRFSAKGNTISGGTIVVSSNSTDTQRCFVIAPGLGITRTGDYTGAKIGAVNAVDCESN